MRRLLTLLSIFLSVTALAQPKADYYSSSTLDGKNGRELELALKAIVYTHDRKSYDDLWTYYQTTDPGPSDSIPSTYTGGNTDLVYDMYAWMSQFPKFYSDNDHSQTSGFNREHCVPNSWWGGKEGCTEAYSDLHHLVPGDGAANNAKGDYPLGEYKSGMTLVFPKETKTNSDNYTYEIADTHIHTEGDHCYNNASHVWKVTDAAEYGGAVDVFEPADEYKGDFARMYLYLVCAYEGELTWQTNYMFTSDDNRQTTILPWAKALLLKWHRQDPVSDKERNRNNAVESIQANRNPFIDFPDLVEYIWGSKSESTDFALATAVSAYGDDYKGNSGESGGNDDSGTATAVELPFSFDGGKADVNSIKGMTQSGLGNDYTTALKLKFDDTNDVLIINFSQASHPCLQYSIKGNQFADGTFDVMESADGTEYTSVKSYTELAGVATVESYELSPQAQYVKFVYTTKATGNVALGDIHIFDGIGRTIESGMYGTICSPCQFTTEGATLYSAEVNAEGDKVLLTEVESPVNGKPYIYKATADGQRFFFDDDAALQQPEEASPLVGVFEDTLAPIGSYVLQIQEGAQKFYKVTDADHQPIVDAYKAYLEVPSSSAKEITIGMSEDVTEGITSFESGSLTEEAGNGDVYNVMGQRITAPVRGQIYIQNGKKHLAK